MIEVHGREPERVLQFVADRAGGSAQRMTPCAASGAYVGGVLVGGIVFHNYRAGPAGAVAEVSAAVDDRRKLVRSMFKVPLDYAFNDAGINRLEARVMSGNQRCMNILERLGFKCEGLMRKGWDGSEDALMFSLLDTDPCRVRGVE